MNKNPIKVGDIVLLQIDDFRDHWPLGKVVKLIPSDDGIIRSVEVLSKGKLGVKTIDRLISLETDIMESSEISDDTLEESTIDRMGSAERPHRQAAIRAADLRST